MRTPAGLAIPAAKHNISGRQAGALVLLGADRGRDIDCALLAVAGHDGSELRLLALELMHWRDPYGAHLSTELQMLPGGEHLRLVRDATCPKHPVQGRPAIAWQRENWTDILTWQARAPMTDTPVHPPLTGTWQKKLAARRASIRDSLMSIRTTVSKLLIATAAVPPMGLFIDGSDRAWLGRLRA